MSDVQRITVAGTPRYIAADGSTTVAIAVSAGDTVSYANAQPGGPSSGWVADGTIAAGSSVSFNTGQWVWCLNGGVVGNAALLLSTSSLAGGSGGGGVPAVVAAGNLGASPTVNLGATTSGTVFVEGALTANCALTLSNLRACNVVLLFTQDTTARTLSVNGTALTITTTASAAFRVDIAVDGTNIYIAEVGAQGDAGPTGPQGDPGPTGATGSTGADGQTTVTENAQTGSYTLVLADAGKSVAMNSASATVLTVPPNSSVAFPIGTVIEVCRLGAGTVTIAQGASVVLRNRLEAAGTTNRLVNAQYSSASLRKRATDEWVLIGDLA